MPAQTGNPSPTAGQVGSGAPGSVDPALSPVVAVLLSRIADPQAWARWEELATQTGYCTNPVRLRGGLAYVDPATGEVTQGYETASEPDGVLLLPCRNRRASVCPSCSATYAADTWQLIAAGLRGGKGMPSSVAEHPRVFATLTAPSFGPVHTVRRPARACRTGSPITCRHGLSMVCPTRHDTDGPVVGAPLCAACFDYPALVLFNALAPKLWVRTVIETRRRLAALTGSTVREVQASVRLSYTKIAEHQRRGAIHVHAVLRLDWRTAAGMRPPSPPYDDPSLLAAAFRMACRRVTVTAPDPADGNSARLIGWGAQSEVGIVATVSAGAQGEAADRSGHAIANYIAKYVTKTLRSHQRPADPADADPYQDHLARIADTCRVLARRPELAELNLDRRVEGLGYPSRPTSRSRSYSTTMGALRQERSRHAAARSEPQTATPDRDDTAIVDADWRYAGRGWRNPGEAGYISQRADQRLAAISHAAEGRARERCQASRADHA